MPSWYTLSKIYVGEEQVRPHKKRYKKYTPTANTLSYLTIREDDWFVDAWTLWWEWREWTVWTNITDNYWHWASWNRMGTWYNTFSTYSSYTCLVRVRSSATFMVSESNYGSGDNWNFTFEKDKINGYNWSNHTISYTSIADGNWHLIALTWQSMIGYVDWVQVWTQSNVQIKPRMVTFNSMRFSSDSHVADYSDFILEDRVWTATEILNYYNEFKSNYWL